MRNGTGKKLFNFIHCGTATMRPVFIIIDFAVALVAAWLAIIRFFRRILRFVFG
jgi:hypothetical protein